MSDQLSGQLEEPQERALSRSIKFQMAVAGIAGILILVMVIQLPPLLRKKAALESEILALDQKKADLEQSYQKTLALLNKETGPSLKQRIKAKAAAKPIAGTKGRYSFTVWLEIPVGLTERITRVEYFFDHPSFSQKQMTSSNPTSGFPVSYDGWGCLSLVTITVHTTDGSSFPIYFNMCEALGF